MELQEDQALQLKYKSTTITEFWENCIRIEVFLIKKRLLVELFQYSEQRTYVNHFISL